MTCPQELQIDFQQYEHPVVLTVEAQVVACLILFFFSPLATILKSNILLHQAKYVGHLKGALSKNLFLKVRWLAHCVDVYFLFAFPEYMTPCDSSGTG